MSRRPHLMPRSLESESCPEQAIGLAYDTSFDDTAVAILRGPREVLANLRLSQCADQALFGGVVPERASRRHLEVIHPLTARALHTAGVEWRQVDYVAVSHQPGLLGALLIGVTQAKTIAWLLDRPLVAVNHIEAHPYASLLQQDAPATCWSFPMVHLVAAGGHTLLLHQRDHAAVEIIGRSIDDAAGECVDKVARLYGLGMPGGAAVDRLACAHRPLEHAFPRPLLREAGLRFSFSGLKTALLYYQKAHPQAPPGPVLAAFMEAIADVLVTKALRAVAQMRVSALSVSGGLAASQFLRQRFVESCAEAGIELFYPPPALCTDNAAMVACRGFRLYQRGFFAPLNLEAHPNLLA